MKRLIIIATLMTVCMWCSTTQAEYFGNTDIGGSSHTYSNDNKESSLYTLSEDADVYRIYGYVSGDGDTQPIKFFIYDVIGDSNLVVTSEEVEITAPGWYSAAVDPMVSLVAADYLIGVIVGTSAYKSWYDPTGTARYGADTYADNPSATLNSTYAGDSRSFSFYAFYLPVGTNAIDVSGVNQVDDTYLDGGGLERNKNFGASTALLIKSVLGSVNRVAPIRLVEIGQDIGAFATITADTLKVYCLESVDDVDIYQIFKPWGDGTQNGVTAASGEASWNDWQATTLEWGAGGCQNASDGGSDNEGDGSGFDRKATPITTLDLSASTWADFDLDGLCQEWYDGTALANGILFESGGDGADDDGFIESTEHADGHDPTFSIYYTIPDSGWFGERNGYSANVTIANYISGGSFVSDSSRGIKIIWALLNNDASVAATIKAVLYERTASGYDFIAETGSIEMPKTYGRALYQRFTFDDVQGLTEGERYFMGVWSDQSGVEVQYKSDEDESGDSLLVVSEAYGSPPASINSWTIEEKVKVSIAAIFLDPPEEPEPEEGRTFRRRKIMQLEVSNE